MAQVLAQPAALSATLCSTSYTSARTQLALSQGLASASFPCRALGSRHREQAQSINDRNLSFRRQRRCCATGTEKDGQVRESAVASANEDASHGRATGKASDVETAADGEGEIVSKGQAVGGSILAAVAVIGTVAAIGGLGFYYKDQINDLLHQFEELIEGLGPLGYLAFVFGYAGLEMLAIPAIPLTMSAGLIFGVLYGTILVSAAGTIAATGAFLVARYLARDRILALAKGNKKFIAIDKAIGNDSFRIVTLLRLSPLLPFSLGNYIYGITSVKLRPYILGSWLGMLPGTWAYVSAGSFGRTLLEAEEGQAFHGTTQLVSLGLGIVVTVGAAAYVTNVAQTAVKELDE